jgi:hypothetical protein
VDARASSTFAKGETMMVRETITTAPNYHLVRINQPEQPNGH